MYPFDETWSRESLGSQMTVQEVRGPSTHGCRSLPHRRLRVSVLPSSRPPSDETVLPLTRDDPPGSKELEVSEHRTPITNLCGQKPLLSFTKRPRVCLRSSTETPVPETTCAPLPSTTSVDRCPSPSTFVHTHRCPVSVLSASLTEE